MNDTNEYKVLYKILRMYFMDNFNQREIAEKLNLSRIKVNRYINYARKNNLVEIHLNIPPQGNAPLELAIEQNFGLNECRIVATSANPEATLKLMALELSTIFDRIIKKNDYLGVSWGTTIEAMAKYIRVKKKKDLKVIPITGGAGIEGSGRFSNFVTKAIADQFDGMSYMINVPAVLDTKEARIIIEKDKQLKILFDLTKRISIVLVGIGDISTEMSLCKIGVLKKRDINYLTRKGAIGMVNMLCIDKNGNHLKNTIDERMINIFPEKLIKKARTSIGVAIGDKKVEVIRAALKGKIINTLITDENTAEKLMRDK